MKGFMFCFHELWPPGAGNSVFLVWEWIEYPDLTGKNEQVQFWAFAEASESTVSCAFKGGTLGYACEPKSVSIKDTLLNWHELWFQVSEQGVGNSEKSSESKSCVPLAMKYFLTRELFYCWGPRQGAF